LTRDTPDVRVAVVLLGAERATLGVYALAASGRLRAHARRTATLADARWPALRETLRPLVALARARHAAQVAIALRTSLKSGPWIRHAREDARRLRCDLLRATVADELRWLFLGGIRAVAAQDGVVAELERGGIALARFRGRVLAATARIGLREKPAASGLALSGHAGALVVSGSLAQDRPPRGAAAAAVKRLSRWTGNGEAVVALDAVAAGLAATLLRAPVPDALRPTRS
jgi:hypothetical protein